MIRRKAGKGNGKDGNNGENNGKTKTIFVRNKQKLGLVFPSFWRIMKIQAGRVNKGGKGNEELHRY